VKTVHFDPQDAQGWRRAFAIVAHPSRSPPINRSTP